MLENLSAHDLRKAADLVEKRDGVMAEIGELEREIESILSGGVTKPRRGRPPGSKAKALRTGRPRKAKAEAKPAGKKRGRKSAQKGTEENIDPAAAQKVVDELEATINGSKPEAASAPKKLSRKSKAEKVAAPAKKKAKVVEMDLSKKLSRKAVAPKKLTAEAVVPAEEPQEAAKEE